MKKYLSYIAYILIGASAALGCQHTSNSAPATTNPILPDSLLKTLQWDTARPRQVVSQLMLNGTVSANQDDVVPIYPMVSGIIRQVHVMLGDHVQKGQVLATIQSPEMTGLSSDLTIASANVHQADIQLEAERQMYANGLATKQDLASAQAAAQKAQADLDKARRVLTLNGGTTNGIYLVRSPISGFITDKQATNQTNVRPDNSNSLFTVSDLKHVWILANVYESNIPEIHLGDSVSVTTLAYPNRIFKGKIDKIYDVLDPVNKVLKVRITLPNPDYALKPQMFAQITTSHPESKYMLSIPSKDLVFDHSRYYVLLYHGKSNITVQPVSIAHSDGPITFISAGLSNGDILVGSQTLLIYQALND